MDEARSKSGGCKMIRSLIIALLILTGCAQTPKNSLTSKVTPVVELPKYTEKTLKNGLKLLIIPDQTLPRVSFSVLVKAGAITDSEDKRGLSYMTAQMLDEGVTGKTSTQLADQLEFLGANLRISPGLDFTTISIGGLAKFKEEIFNILNSLLTEPTFPNKELERLRRQAVSQLERISDEPEEYSDFLFQKTLFGDRSAYAYPVIGHAKTIKQLSRSDVDSFYKQYYSPGNLTIAVVGQVDEFYVANLEKKLAQWKSKGVSSDKKVGEGHVAVLPGGTYLTSKAGLQQTRIEMGHLGIHRADPDFLKVRIANTILGGGFASRLNQYVRDDKGLTYSIYSQFDARRFAGPFQISTFTRNDKVKDTLEAVKKVYSEFYEKGVTKEELSAAKSLLVGQFPKAIETVDRLAFNLLVLRYYDVPDSYLTNYIATINGMTLEDVNLAIKKHFKPSALMSIVYGDEAQIGSQLK